MNEKQEVTLDNAINACGRIQELTSEINDAWLDVIRIFQEAAEDCFQAAETYESENNDD